MYLWRQTKLCMEVYKIINELNPGYMNDIFKLLETNSRKIYDKPGNAKTQSVVM